MSKLINVDEEYKEWIHSVSQRFKRSQIKAAIKVNDEMLRFYWSLGRDIHTMGLESKYGSGFYKTVSEDLKHIFPETHSFSQTNIRYMCRFYELYPNASLINEQIVPQVGAKTNDPDAENRPQVGDDSEIVFCIPWGHNKVIIDKCRGNRDKALFYVHKTLENGWSRAMLLNFLDTGLYERQGKATTNFVLTLPEENSDLAQEITKDPYNFDFLDMLFFNYITRCFVVLEIKAGDFESPNTGQLGTYVVAVNHQMKEEWMNPTIGLLICKDKDEIEAQYALESSSQPLGISSYELSNLIPDNYKGSLPTIEEIEAELAE